jgi:hypothetical protein
MEKLQNKYRRFREWEQQPHEVAPLSEEQHVCATCSTHYEGNYCPRCGQSCKIVRYSFKNAFLLYLDVWGLGNRGMFRSIRDLILRPGYMIRDYLRGMQMAYFPPFKMFFLLCTLSLIVDTGFNIQGINRSVVNEKAYNQILGLSDDKEENAEEETEETNDKKYTPEQARKRKLAHKAGDQKIDRLEKWGEKHSSVMALASLLLFSWPLWLMIRRCPAIPDLRFSECFVAMVYIINMFIIYNTIPSLLCFRPDVEIIYWLLSLLLILIPIKQLTGYSYPSVIWRVFVALIPFCFLLLLLFAVAGVAIYLYYDAKYGVL